MIFNDRTLLDAFVQRHVHVLFSFVTVSTSKRKADFNEFSINVKAHFNEGGHVGPQLVTILGGGDHGTGHLLEVRLCVASLNVPGSLVLSPVAKLLLVREEFLPLAVSVRALPLKLINGVDLGIFALNVG